MQSNSPLETDVGQPCALLSSQRDSCNPAWYGKHKIPENAQLAKLNSHGFRLDKPNGIQLVSRLKSSFKNSAAPPHVERCSLRAAISPQCHRQRPITSIRSPGRHGRGCQSESFSSGATRGDYEANGAVQGAPEQIDCGLEDHFPTRVGPYGEVRQ
jgi:hypothetical protein